MSESKAMDSSEATSSVRNRVWPANMSGTEGQWEGAPFFVGRRPRGFFSWCPLFLSVALFHSPLTRLDTFQPFGTRMLLLTLAGWL